MLDPHYCRLRQNRLLNRLAQRRLDAIVCGAPHHVYYFTGHWTFWQQHSAFVLFADGRSWLCAANTKPQAAADTLTVYQASWMGSQRQEQPAALAAHVIDTLKSHRAKRIAFDASVVSSQLPLRFAGTCESIDEDLFQLRRRKDPDELALMKSAIGCTEAMYARARQIISPGIPELQLFAELHAVAVQTAGEPLSGLLGNDYACAAPGGPPRNNRLASPGELYILDLGPAYRGYFSDSARTFSVDRHPTNAQFQAWQAIVGCHQLITQLAKPGVRCRDLFNAVDEFLKSQLGTGLPHHLGHGVGLQPHEFPHLNPHWDDVLQEGDLFAAEPGTYHPDLRAGIRIENNYLVTPTGVESLLTFPMDLT
ncbi:MAG TPA: Xaa-Pro peptidase family protein [Tepidisphaeraceae bacterium]|nr:Xaa-Pro peptidase family protein [Tepidisphaeraceae bacterium]